VGGALTIVSSGRKEDLVLPGSSIAPRSGPGPLVDDLGWAEGLHLTSDARTLVDNLAVSRGRGGRVARTLSRSELEDWVVADLTETARELARVDPARALELCDELDVPERRALVEDLIGIAAGTEWRAPARTSARGHGAAGHEYDPDRVARLRRACFLPRRDPVDPRCATRTAALEDEPDTSLPFFEADFSNFIEGTEFSVD